MSAKRDVKCEAAARVIDALGDLDVLYIGAFAIGGHAGDPWAWGTQPSDELQLLIKHKDLDAFMGAMDGGYVLATYELQGNRCVELDRVQVRNAILSMPASPEVSYAQRSCINQPGEPDLWTTFHTTTRHGRLLLVDLADWFKSKEEAQVMADTAFPRTIYRPPLWAMLLWQAAEVTCAAAEWAVTDVDVDRLRAVAGNPDLDWSLVRNTAQAYDKEYGRRLRLDAADRLLRDYQAYLGITDDAHMNIAERQYGALYELSHALKAVKDNGGTVDPAVWNDLQPIIASQPRKIWAYPGVMRGKTVPAPHSPGGRLWIARDDFGIKEQIQYCASHPKPDFDHLLSQGLISQLIPDPGNPNARTAPPHGPWADCKQPDMASMGLA